MDAAAALRTSTLLTRLIQAASISRNMEGLCRWLLIEMLQNLDASVAVFSLMEGEEPSRHLHARWMARRVADGTVEVVPAGNYFPVVTIDAETMNGRAMTSRNSVVGPIEDWPPVARELGRALQQKHALVVPLFSADRPVASLSLMRDEQPPFEQSEVQLAEVAGTFMAQAIENARFIEAEKDRARLFEDLLEIHRSITQSLDTETILTLAGHRLASITHATHVYIWRFDAPTQMLHGLLTTAVEDVESFRAASFPLAHQSLAADAILTRGLVIQEDTLEKSRSSRDLTPRYGVRSLMSLPLMVQGEPIGVVTIADKRGPRPWTSSEQLQATLVSGQLAISLANARLFEDLKASYARLEAAQAHLVERERLAAIGELSAIVAHEVRNPLAVIYNSMSALSRDLSPSPQAAALLAIINEECERLNAIVGDLLDFAKPVTPMIQLLELSALVDETLERIRALPLSEGIQLRVDLSGAPLRIPVDSHMFRQALFNLSVNAIQAIAKTGGEMRIVGTRGIHPNGEAWWGIEVQDSGPGLSDDIKDRVFQPFFTTRAAGSGLGLALVKRFAESHHGTIAAGNAAKGGAVFTLRLPLVDAPLDS